MLHEKNAFVPGHTGDKQRSRDLNPRPTGKPSVSYDSTSELLADALAPGFNSYFSMVASKLETKAGVGHSYPESTCLPKSPADDLVLY